jgi:DNA repair protein RecO (recombination protein O)
VAAETVTAVLLRRIRFSDTSLILTWFSRERGKFKTIARGALRPKSGFAGKLDLFFQCELTVSWSRRSELHGLRETVLLESFAGIRESYSNTLAAGYFAELVEETTEPDHPETAIYQLLIRAFSYLQTTPVTGQAVLFFELELAKAHGLATAELNEAVDQLLHSSRRTRASRAQLMALLRGRRGEAAHDK